LPLRYLNFVRVKKESFLPGLNLKSSATAHGGEHSRGRRKTYRPIDPKQALHVVLRSSLARGERSLLHPKHCDHVHDFTKRVAHRWGVRIYRYANVGNHIHLLIKVPSRAAWQRFLRELAGGIALIVTGAKKGDSLAKNDGKRGFWDHLAFTRIVNFGRDFAGVGRYLIKNVFEGAGVPVKKLLEQGLRVLTINDDGSVSGGPPG
jgi:REP element-mobilizing transposase RayT